ncbi:MAG: zinc ABC transporter substrate-binding protein [Candidatus Competibacteraceae bacterium]|nr:zinc ABC transporter substrate-binding protein [Candidatus Competibacteraceae bacterium]
MTKCNRLRLRWLLWLGCWALLPPSPAWAEARVAASIKPLHSLVAGVMHGVAEPALLVQGGASPHDYSLRPSDARALSEADAVFWIGPELETFLVKPLDNAKERVRSIRLSDAPGLAVLPLRSGGAWETHAHDPATPGEHRHANAAHGDEKFGRDAHVWLDPRNAVAMVRHIVSALGEVDPAHRADYERNGALLIERLEQLDRQIAAELAPVRERPYIVFHDAYQYFERRYGLGAAGSVVLSPEQRPGARRITEIRSRIRGLKVRCVFSEPQFQPALVETLLAGSAAHRGVLDPLGAELPAGPEAYFQLLRGLSASLRDCLGKERAAS